MPSELRIETESWNRFWPESQLMLADHRAEVEPQAREPFQVNVPLCEAMYEAGAMSITSARSEGALVGYSLWYLSPSLDSLSLCATQGPWYVLPSWRKGSLALRLFKASLADLRTRGIVRALPHHWTDGAGERLGRYFERLGAKKLETTYSLYLED